MDKERREFYEKMSRDLRNPWAPRTKPGQKGWTKIDYITVAICSIPDKLREAGWTKIDYIISIVCLLLLLEVILRLFWK